MMSDGRPAGQLASLGLRLLVSDPRGRRIALGAHSSCFDNSRTCRLSRRTIVKRSRSLDDGQIGARLIIGEA